MYGNLFYLNISSTEMAKYLLINFRDINRQTNIENLWQRLLELILAKLQLPLEN